MPFWKYMEYRFTESGASMALAACLLLVFGAVGLVRSVLKTRRSAEERKRL